jgi:predicted O-linked N-acetylglucosamine transferase (SPINDLY family)
MTDREAFELALSHYQAGRPYDAGLVLRQILLEQPDHADALHLAGVLEHRAGRSDEGAAFIRRAIAIAPNVPDYHNNLGLILAARGEVDEGTAALQKAIQLRPDFARAHNNLGSLYSEKRQWDPAISSFRTALALDPAYAEAESNLASALKETGDLDQAVERYRRAASFRGDPKIGSNLVYLLYFHPQYGPAEVAEAHREWNRAFAAPLARAVRPHTNDRTPDRKLRVGYVSPDFRQHAVGRFIAPLFEHHNHEPFEIYCYSDVKWPDAMTRRLQGDADAWRDTGGMSDEQLAELVRSDRIDILIDLTMHMEGSRLLAFARKPAPVQITYLAYAGTTGLPTMDYRLSDPYLDPLNSAVNSHYSEKTLRLRSYWCYESPAEAPAIVPPPAESVGHITFGCLNAFSKVSGPALDAWAGILARVPNARLILHSGEGSHRDRVVARFAGQSISPSRVEFVTRLSAERYFAQYNRIDIALDPFPYPGGTTSCDALWMGVPVVTLAGSTAVGRAGVSILSTIKLPELIACGAEEYGSIAVGLAADAERRAALRSGLRGIMKEAPLMDAAGFARDFEGILRAVWRA